MPEPTFYIMDEDAQCVEAFTTLAKASEYIAKCANDGDEVLTWVIAVPKYKPTLNVQCEEIPAH